MPHAWSDGFAPDGLAYRATGASRERPPLVIAHGFTQNARAWGSFAEALARRRPVVAVDLPGHGRSALVSGDLWETSRRLAATGGTADYLGYSMGGRVALHLALEQPALVRRLVLIGATAGIDDDEERQRRRLADDELADQLDPLDPGGPVDQQRRLDQFLERWLAQPLFASLAPETACLAARRTNRCAGLANSLRTCGTGTQQPLWDRLAELTVPVLLVAGAEDHRFGALAARMAAAIGSNAQTVLVPDAGHACHLQRPSVVADMIEDFLLRA